MTVETAAQLQQRINDIVTPGFGSRSIDIARLLGNVLDSGLAATPETVAGTAYTLVAADHNKLKITSSASAVTITVPAGLGFPFICGISQGAAGQVTLSAGSGATINEPDSLLATEKQYVILTLFATAANVFLLSGRTA